MITTQFQNCFEDPDLSLADMLPARNFKDGFTFGREKKTVDRTQRYDQRGKSKLLRGLQNIVFVYINMNTLK